MTSVSLIKDVELFLDDKPSVFALRNEAKQFFLNAKVPSKKNEAWKYSNVKEILESDFDVLENDEEECKCGCCSHHSDESFLNIVFCKGRLHIEEYNLPKGVNVISLAEVLYDGEYKKYIHKTYDLEKNFFASLNGVYLEQGVCLVVDEKIKEPIIIRYRNDDANNLMMNVHNLFLLNKNSKIEVVEEFLSSDDNKYFMNVVDEFLIKEGASFNHYKVQRESFNAYHIALNSIKLEKHAEYKQYYLSNGAKISRNETLVNLDNDDARAEVFSMYRAKKGCLTDITTNVNHNVSNTHSNQYAKAVLEEDSGAVFQGKVYIAKDAVKSEGNQLHKALYLGDAELNCKPELEIYADDVKCSHGATSGEVDKEQLFYLTSRGIAKEDAFNMLIEAHLEEIVSLVPNEDIRYKFFNSIL